MDFFPAGVVVSADDLVGRETTIIRWMTWLMGGQSIFVAGPRRRGKSSVAQEVVRRLGHRGRMALSLDCSAYESEDAFAAAWSMCFSRRRLASPACFSGLDECCADWSHL